MKKATSRWAVGLGLGLGLALCAPVWADNKAAAIDEMAGYLEFVDYGGATIFPEQIPKD